MSAILGKVVRVLSPTELVVNLGSAHGISDTSRFVVFTPGDELTDPDTGEPLGQLEIVRGRAEAKHVQEKMSTIRSIEKKTMTRDRSRLAPGHSPFASGIKQPMFETVTEEVLVDAPFQGAQVNDLVRVL